jgi:hypothetical protein
MKTTDILIAARALSLDGGEGSGVRGHTTERPKDPVQFSSLSAGEQRFRVKWLARKFALNGKEASEFASHPSSVHIEHEAHDWAFSKGVAHDSPVSRGHTMALVRGKGT